MKKFPFSLFIPLFVFALHASADLPPSWIDGLELVYESVSPEYTHNFFFYAYPIMATFVGGFVVFGLIKRSIKKVA